MKLVSQSATHIRSASLTHIEFGEILIVFRCLFQFWPSCRASGFTILSRRTRRAFFLGLAQWFTRGLELLSAYSGARGPKVRLFLQA
jgi:hypothetical protein